MKKLMILLPFVVSLASAVSPHEKAEQEYVQYLQGVGSDLFSKGALAAALLGGTAGAAWSEFGPTKGWHLLPEDKYDFIRTPATGVLGAATGYLGTVALNKIKRTIIPYLINRMLSAHTVYSFEMLDPAEALLVYGAYMRNAALMHAALQHEAVVLFVAQPGVWQTLADLYFNQRNSDRLYQLQKVLGIR